MPIADDADTEVTAEALVKAEALVRAEALRPNRGALLCGSAPVALISAASLPWPEAIASTVLGALMIAVLLVRRREQAIERTAKGPFGAFPCPALRLLYYATRLQP